LASEVLPGFKKMPYEFAPDVERLLKEQMEAGKYTSEDDVLRDALTALRDRNEDMEAIREGIADMEAGRMRPLEEVSERISRKYGFASDG
jgi:antitoxin ParD1/3/4